MKGSSYTLPAKRRWKGLVIAVLGLVFLSMLVPLVFLLGLYNGFHSVAGHAIDRQSSDSSDLNVYDKHDGSNTRNQPELDHSTHVDDLLEKLKPTLPKEFGGNLVKEAENKTGGYTEPPGVPEPHPIPNNPGTSVTVEVAEYAIDAEDGGKSCEVKFGSYCLWRQEHREKMKDYMVKKLKDQLFVARAYYPSVAKLPAHDKLSREMKQNIQEFERILSDTTTDTDLPPQIKKKLHKMEAVIARAKSFVMDCNNVDKKLRQLVDLTEDEANFHSRQSAFLYQLAVQTMPKSHHCLSMRLTVEYFSSSSLDMDKSLAEKYLNPALQHFVIFSKNVLASSVVINSTVMHAKESRNLVFHVLTDQQNYYAMKLWFFIYTYKDATVQVLNIEDLSLKDNDNALNKVVVLDDDIVVQRDLSTLWSLDMEGKVIGAVQSCTLRLGQLKNYLGKSGFDGNSCAWVTGLNVVDLVSWRERHLTETFWKLVQEQPDRGGVSLEADTMRATLLTFDGLIHALSDTWVLSGLGYNYGLDIQAIKKVAVLHFNGNMKPWLELGIPKYKVYWRNFLDPENRFLSACNINP